MSLEIPVWPFHFLKNSGGRFNQRFITEYRTFVRFIMDLIFIPLDQNYKLVDVR